MNSRGRSFLSLLRRSTCSDLTPPSLHFSSRIPSKQHFGPFILCRKSPRPRLPSPSLPSSSSFCSFPSFVSPNNGFVSWYLRMIESRPVLTKSFTASAIFTAADVSSQMIRLSTSDSLDPVRTLRMAGYGLLFSGPSLHLWFNFVSKVLPRRDLMTTLKKLLLGQLTFGPVMTAVFFSVNAALQGESNHEIGARLKRDMIPTLINGVIYWPMCDFVTFKFIPVRLQPLVSNSFSFLWTIYITYMASLKKVDMNQNSAA